MPGGFQNCETLGRFMLQFHGRDFRRLSNEGSRRQRQTLLIGRSGRKEWRPARRLLHAMTSHCSYQGRWNARRAQGIQQLIVGAVPAITYRLPVAGKYPVASHNGRRLGWFRVGGALGIPDCCGSNSVDVGTHEAPAAQ